MPSDNTPTSFVNYLNTLGELKAIDSQQCDRNVIAGDFNVGFGPGGPLASLFCGFVSDRDSVVCDLSFVSPLSLVAKGMMVVD